MVVHLQVRQLQNLLTVDNKDICVKMSCYTRLMTLKYDDGKRRWNLLPWEQLEEVVKVLEHGSKKYSDDNWKTVAEGRRRYSDALMRHAIACMRGETHDEDNNPHLASIVCNALFLLWFENQEKKMKEDENAKRT